MSDATPWPAVKIFADGADLDRLLSLAEDERVRGFTTNPTLMRKAGVEEYERFARAALGHITDRPISFEVFSDDIAGMRAQALEIASWGTNVYVKIPVTNTRCQSTADLVYELSHEGVHLNVTALMTLSQVETITSALKGGVASNISVFAGRIADSGRDPVPIMREALDIMEAEPLAELIWASPREVLNIVQAADIGCHIITVTYDLLGKLRFLGKDLDEFSLETVQMFHRDAHAAGYAIEPARAR
jgi:transaldolase